MVNLPPLHRLRALTRQEIIDYATLLIQESHPNFFPDIFDRVRVFVREDLIRVLFEMSRRYVPYGKESRELSYSVEVIFSREGTVILFPDNLFLPTEESYAALSRFSDIELQQDAYLTVKDCGNFLEGIYSEGLDGEKVCYRFDKVLGVRQLAWQEIANPSLRTSLLGLDKEGIMELD